MADKIFVTRSSMPSLEEYVREIAPMWESRYLTNMGPKHEELKQRLVEFLGVENLELFTNGHMALELSLQALKLSGEVITTPFTFASTTQAIVRNGLTPVFCDVNPHDFTMDVSLIESLITPRTCAILPVHVYGNVCDVEAIQEIADRHGLKVIYDAAHTFGMTYKGRGIGSFGDVSCFSFHATKVFHTIEGGAACFRDATLGDAMKCLKNFGIRGGEEIPEIGANAKMNEFCAAMGLCNLRHVNEDIAGRKVVVERYRERLQGVKGIQLNAVQPEVSPNYAYFPVFFDPKACGKTRDEVRQRLEEHGFFTRRYFYPLTSAFQCYDGRFNPTDTPVALRLSYEVLALPLFPDLSLESVDEICQVVLS